MATKEATEAKGISWLQEHIEGTLGTEVSSTKLRVILRGLVKAGEIEHEDGHGWTFTGIKDPAVRGVIAKLKEQAKAPAKEAKASKATPAKATKPRRGKAAKKAAEPEEDLFEDEDIDLDD